MEKDLYRGRREDPKAGPRAPDKTGKPITPGKMKASALDLLNKSFKEAKEKQEYDYEGDMAMSQLKSIIANAQRMHDMLERDTNIPEWVQSKITLAEDYISTASNYMQGEMKEDVDAYADALIKRNKQNLNKGHVVNAARIAGMDDKKLMAAVNKKVGRIKEEVAVNSAGAGNVAGIGVGPDGEPGVKKKKKNVVSFNRFMRK